LAEHITLKKFFAVKSLSAKLTEDSGFRERFFNEAINQAKLDHQNIVQATDFFEVDGQYFLVMEFVSGQSLNDLIKKDGKLCEADAIRILKDILRGLNFAHSKGVIHRDIKPSNVIVDEAGRARITDFGIAILVGEKRLTATGAHVGSSWYMSPEQILHPGDIDHRSDVYSAGIVLYEMLTGDVPFDGESEFTIQNKQVRDSVPDPAQKNSKLTPALKKILLQALEKNPDKRFSGCGEFLKRIEEYEKGLEKSKPAARSNPARVIVLLAITSTMVFGTFWLYVNYNNTSFQISPAEKKPFNLSTNKNRFHIGENLLVNFTVAKELYVYIAVVNMLGKVERLFPNPYQTDNFCKPGITYQIPPENSDTSIAIEGPAGKDKIVLIAGNQPLTLGDGAFSNSTKLSKEKGFFTETYEYFID
jgi:serine/threonine protein kinase